MAHIKKIENGKYRACVEIGTGSKRRRRYKTFDKKRDAQVWIGNTVTEREDGTLVNPDDVTVAEFFLRFLKNYKKPYVATTTYNNYYLRYENRIKPDLGDLKMQEVEPYHIESYFNRLRRSGRLDGEPGGISENTLKKLYVILNQGFKKAVKLRLIKNNPLEPIDSPIPEKKEAACMKRDEFNRLLKTAKKHDYFMFVFVCTILYTGLRKSEALALEWSSINFEEGTLQVKKRLVNKRGVGTIIEEKTKTKSSRRIIKISNRLVSILKGHKRKQLEMRLQLGPEYHSENDFVFAKDDGTPFSTNWINKRLTRLLRKAKLATEYGIHTLRHTFATINLENKVSPKVVQIMLGHSTISTTLDIYSHVDIEMQKEAVAKLDDAINLDM